MPYLATGRCPALVDKCRRAFGHPESFVNPTTVPKAAGCGDARGQAVGAQSAVITVQLHLIARKGCVPSVLAGWLPEHVDTEGRHRPSPPCCSPMRHLCGAPLDSKARDGRSEHGTERQRPKVFARLPALEVPSRTRVWRPAGIGIAVSRRSASAARARSNTSLRMASTMRAC